jgi:hypothetical protein
MQQGQLPDRDVGDGQIATGEAKFKGLSCRGREPLGLVGPGVVEQAEGACSKCAACGRVARRLQWWGG